MCDYLIKHTISFDFIVECVQCGVIKISPLPKQEVLARFYSDYYATQHYLAKEEKKILRARNRLKRLKKITGTGKFLDVGCSA